MSLTNQQYDRIIKYYRDKQISIHNELNDRRNEIYEKVPGYKELDDKVASFSLDMIRRSIYGADLENGNSDSTIDDLSNKKRELLTSYGYPANYLDPFYECDDCKDTGFIDGYKCHCFKKKESELLFEQSNLNEIIKYNNFSLLSYDYYQGEDLERFKKAVKDSIRFIEDFDDQYENIIFQGSVGTGKSFLSSCIACELLKKDYQVVYFSASEMFNLLLEVMFSKNKNYEAEAYKDLIYSADLLIIDDLGTEITNSAIISQLFSVLNERHLNFKSTIISTNLEINQLQDRYTDRIFSRLLERYSFKKIDGPDIRKIKNSL